MTCQHLLALEEVLITHGFEETFRGQAWSQNVREWVYFKVCLNLPAVREMFRFDPCVVDHVYAGTHDGKEAGLECTEHHDGIMGVHPDFSCDVPVFP
jgi:1-aminocyclopropane-1-carboxylate deaminase/D-cysteine desulfhydrase-like pyridoxal-dependent ACC family enzyme